MTGKRRKGRDPVPEPTPEQTPEPEPTPESSEESSEEAIGQLASEPDRDPTFALPPTPTPAPASRISRRRARQERKRQQRRRIGLLGGIVIAAVVLILVAVGVFVGHTVATHHSSPADQQTTVLFQLQNPDHTAGASVLLAHDSQTRKGVEVLVPARLISDVCGYSTSEFGSVLALPGGEAASRQAVSTILDNVTVDGSWILTPTQLATLIDRIGGITVDVDVDVVRPGAGGSGTVLVPAGANRKLTGTQAVEYATYSTSASADASIELARLQEVIDATATKFTSTTAVAAVLRQLGPSAASTLGVSRLADFLVGFGDSERTTGKLLPTDLPVTTVDAGGPPSYRVDAAPTQALVTRWLDKSVPTGSSGSHPTVELLNGVGTPGLVATACPRLAAHGLTYAGSGNAGSFNNPTSTVAVSTPNVALGYQVASALGLPRSDVRRTTVDQTVADAIVTLGNDYRP